MSENVNPPRKKVVIEAVLEEDAPQEQPPEVPGEKLFGDLDSLGRAADRAARAASGFSPEVAEKIGKAAAGLHTAAVAGRAVSREGVRVARAAGQAVDRLEAEGVPLREWASKIFTTTPLPDFPRKKDE